jgi:translocation and assembly module TamA
LPVSHGGKYRFGVITSDLPKFLSSKHLQRIARFKPGEIYKRSDEMDLRKAIIATGLVSTVTVTPRATQPPVGKEPGIVDMDIGLTKAPLRTISGALGYGTGEGFRAEASWEHRNLFPPEGSLRVRGVVGTREQLAGVTFRRNNFLGRDRVLTFDTYATTIKRDAYDARTVSVAGSYERISTMLYQKSLTWSAGFEILATDEKAPNTTDGRLTYFIGALPVSVGLDFSNDLLDPSKGFRVSARFSPEISVQSGQKSTYVRAQVDASGYFPVSDKIVIAGRAKVASIVGAPVDNIALSRRIYAGGGGSVRGYSYQGIGPRNSDNDPTGGASAVELSLEARVRTGMFGGALSIVPFVDAGAVGRDSMPGIQGMQFGAGIGVRYHTTFGPIRIDVATPINRRKGDPPVGVYVGLGQAF